MQANAKALALMPSMLLIAATLLASADVMSQQAAPRRPGWLQPGAEWHYVVVHGDTERPKGVQPAVHVVRAETTATLPDGRRLHQLRVDRGKAGVTTFEVWSTTGGKALQYATRAMDRRGTWRPKAAPMQIWRADADGQPPQWSWQGPLPGADLGSGNRAADAGEGTWRHQAESLGRTSIEVPAGTFEVEHIRIRSERAGKQDVHRDVWLHPSVGVVREERRCGSSTRTQQLKKHVAGAGRDDRRLIAYVEDALRKNTVEAFNNAPQVSWLEAGPEAMAIAGRVATVHTDTWKGSYLVGRDRCRAFDIRAGLAPAAYVAFDKKTAVPDEHTDLHALALLLARSQAALRQFGNVHEVAVTLEPSSRMAPAKRSAAVQVTGGALDGSQRNIAVWLTFDRRWQCLTSDDVPKSGR